MAIYRAFLVDQFGGLAPPELVLADDDNDAIARATALLKSSQYYVACEVWQEARMVRRIMR